MNKVEIQRQAEDYIESMESQLDNIYNAPLTTDGWDYLMKNIDKITFCEDEIEEASMIIDFLDEDDEVVRNFFGKNNHDATRDC